MGCRRSRLSGKTLGLTMGRSLKIAIAAFYAALLVLTPMVYHWRPLITSSSLQVAYVDGQSTRHDARVYRMLFRPQVVFIELPARGNSAGRWFAVDLDERTVVFPTGSPDRSPYLHYNHDMTLGVPVDDTLKHDDLWRVIWSAGEVAWSYGSVTVRLGGT